MLRHIASQCSKHPHRVFRATPVTRVVTRNFATGSNNKDSKGKESTPTQTTTPQTATPQTATPQTTTPQTTTPQTTTPQTTTPQTKTPQTTTPQTTTPQTTTPQTTTPQTKTPQTPPPQIATPPTTQKPAQIPSINANKNQQDRGRGDTGGDKKGGGTMRVIFYSLLVGAALATGAMMHPDSRKKLESWGVLSAIDSVRDKFIPALSTGAKTTKVPAVPPAVANLPPVAPIAVTVDVDPIDPARVVVDSEQQSSLPVPIVPLSPADALPIDTEVIEIIPVEIIEVIQEPILLDPVSEVGSPIPVEQETVSEVLNELMNELSERAPSLTVIPSDNEPKIDFHSLLNEQTIQLEALRDKLQQYYSESNKDLDYKVKAHEAAYREALELRDRVYRAELADKLAQLRAELQAQHDKQRDQDRTEAQVFFKQQFERQKGEIERTSEEAFKHAVENAEALYSVRLAEEINKFDSKLAVELQNEDAKYNASYAERIKTIEHLKTEVVSLENLVHANSARFKESIHLHNISAALFDLSSTTLAAPARSSFVSELQKLEAASKALPRDTVIAAVADVLRPLAVEGIAPYNELTERFKTVVASGRQAALVPEGGGVMENLMAAVASKLIIPAKGPVAGDSPEAIFAKAEYYLTNGSLNEAVSQLSQLRGLPASIVRDWLQAASNRLTVENALRALHAHVIVLAHQQA